MVWFTYLKQNACRKYIQSMFSFDKISQETSLTKYLKGTSIKSAVLPVAPPVGRQFAALWLVPSPLDTGQNKPRRPSGDCCSTYKASRHFISWRHSYVMDRRGIKGLNLKAVCKKPSSENECPHFSCFSFQNDKQSLSAVCTNTHYLLCIQAIPICCV